MFKECLYRNNNGHRFFRDERGRISICDQSGDTPEQTDDGPLVVQPDAVCTVQFHAGLSVSVPVTRTCGGSEGTVWLTPRDFSVLRTLVPVSVVQSEGFRKHMTQIEMLRPFADQDQDDIDPALESLIYETYSE